jgi:uncharacterized protein
MDQRLSIVTLGVADLARARKFYCKGLGWKESSASQPAVSFIDAGGVVLGLFGRHALAEDACLADAPPSPPGAFEGITLAHNVRSKQAVDKVLAEAVKAGAALLKPGQDVFWGGYSGYFADPDGHAWEVAWNPFFPMDKAGRVKLPKAKRKVNAAERKTRKKT